MKLLELLQQVREQNLTKSALEDLYSHFLNLFSITELELAELEKKEAVFLEESKEETEAAKKRKWNVTPEGQMLIVLKRQSKVIEKQLSSVKHRIYAQY